MLLHSTLVLVALLIAPTLPQQRLDPSRLYPVTAPVRHAGTVDVTTGTWTRTGAADKASVQTLFNNTCTWVGGQYYAAFDWCEEVYDEGRVPSPSSFGAPSEAATANRITSIQVSYCTFAGPLAAAGGYDMDVALFDNLGGPCAGTVPPTPPPVSSTATAYLPLAGLGLPGSSAFGMRACWIVTLDTSNAGFVLVSDGDGLYTNQGDDVFSFMQRQNQTQGAFQQASPDGFLIAGEPQLGGFGTCSYSIPCVTDPFSGLPCGTGLDSFDVIWINVDGIGVGSSASPPSGCANSVAQYGFGTNCYFFGGYPGQPWNSIHLKLEGEPLAPQALAYCAQTKASSVAGCTAVLSAPDLTLASGSWHTTQIPRHSSLGIGTTFGIYIYTHGVGDGPSLFVAQTPFGSLCLTGFARSAPACIPAVAQTFAGFCNLSLMSTALSCNAGALGLAVGEDVNVQLWYRDPTPANSGNANFSNALFYTLQ